MNRYFRRSDGAWLHDMFGGAALDIPAESHIASVAARHGLGVLDIEVIEAEDDPRTGDVIRGADEEEPLPDPDGFLAAARDEYGRGFWFQVAAKFPGVAFILAALDKGDWESVRDGVDAMAQAGAVNASQRTRLHAILDEHHVPPTTELGA
jgi:hypothetical protein